MFQRIRNAAQLTSRKRYNVSQLPWKLPQEDVETYPQEDFKTYETRLATNNNFHGEHVTTYQERLGGYLKKTLKHMRHAYNLHQEHVTTYQERLGSYLEKMLKHLRHVLQLSSRTCDHVYGTSWKLPQKDVRHVLPFTSRTCYNVSGRS